MTTAEKNALKLQLLEQTVNSLRRTVRHNGAPISTKASISEIADNVLEFNTDRVKTLWTDINTIDRVKEIMCAPMSMARRPNLTTEELLGYAVNDERLTAESKSWAVVKIGRNGTEILTYGGDYYQKYRMVTTEGEVTTVQEGDTELLKKALESDDAAWMANVWEYTLTGKEDTYSEGGVDFVQIPCELPGSIEQLLSIRISRKDEFGLTVEPLAYSLTEKSCTTEHEGMLGLPHGMWLIYDNSGLESAPRALLVPVELVEGGEGNKPFTGLEIRYNALVSGLERLRLISESFGTEYIVSTQDIEIGTKGTWLE